MVDISYFDIINDSTINIKFNKNQTKLTNNTIGAKELNDKWISYLFCFQRTGH